jgi:hypothetical protein
MDLTQKFEGWLPVRVFREGGEAMVDWCRMGDARFTDPFFRTTVDRVRRTPFNLTFPNRTSIELLADLRRAGRPAVEPTGFIFHMSRCGSTLVSQMLSSLPGTIVLSEPPPVDDLFRLCRGGMNDNARDIVKAMVHCLAEPRQGETRFFLKFDPWNVADLPLIRSAFPEVPWVFLYREPLEVMSSQMREPAASMMPGNLTHPLPGISIEGSFSIEREEYAARALRFICERALEHSDDTKGLFVEYKELPAAVFEKIASHFGLELTDNDIELMRGASTVHAKTGDKNYTVVNDQNRTEVSDAVRRAADEFIRPVYDRLRKVNP